MDGEELDAEANRPTAATMSPDRPHRHGGRGTPLALWVRIFVASVMLTTGAGALVTHDLLARWDLQARLQVDATRMAIAAAVFLPDAPARAVHAAARSAEVHGLNRSRSRRGGAGPDVVQRDAQALGAGPAFPAAWFTRRAGDRARHRENSSIRLPTPARRPDCSFDASSRKKSLNALSPRSRGGEVLTSGC